MQETTIEKLLVGIYEGPCYKAFNQSYRITSNLKACFQPATFAQCHPTLLIRMVLEMWATDNLESWTTWMHVDGRNQHRQGTSSLGHLSTEATNF